MPFHAKDWLNLLVNIFEWAVFGQLKMEACIFRVWEPKMSEGQPLFTHKHTSNDAGLWDHWPETQPFLQRRENHSTHTCWLDCSYCLFVPQCAFKNWKYRRFFTFSVGTDYFLESDHYMSATRSVSVGTDYFLERGRWGTHLLPVLSWLSCSAKKDVDCFL